MPLKTVRYVNGNNRRRCEATIRHLNALLAYNAKQPPGSFLISSQVTAFQTTIGVLEALLSAVRFV